MLKEDKIDGRREMRERGGGKRGARAEIGEQWSRRHRPVPGDTLAAVGCITQGTGGSD